ncbi:hypothetical protein [Singulisphaera sp. GP187]|uniref:hypothetical protein n=1 Tax=Singulisphaera sp. GP187 TaxID=1882752 RepID=UPI00116124D8|nr:hypothetical protein [Singulisphaera sp. GP187]
MPVLALPGRSERLVLWVTQACGITEDVDEKGKRGVLKPQASRATFLSDESHRIRFGHTLKSTS